MQPTLVRRAVRAAEAVAAAHRLPSGPATVVHNSDRIVVRLGTSAVLARVAPSAWQAGMQQELDAARQLASLGSPVGPPYPDIEPTAYLQDGFAITWWTFYETRVVPGSAVGPGDIASPNSSLAAEDYARALRRLHADLRRIELDAPPVLDRIENWASGARDHGLTPDLAAEDRGLIGDVLERGVELVQDPAFQHQLLHGEPHADNVLSTANGPRFIDLTCQTGPVEYDLAYVPHDVAEQYSGTDAAVIDRFRAVMWAGVATMRWSPHDQFPDRDAWRTRSLDNLRGALRSSGWF